MNPYSNCINNLEKACVDGLKYVYANTDGMISFNEVLLLYCLAKEAKTGCIVEVGSYRGKSSVFLGKGSLAGFQLPVYAVEPHKNFTGR
jgi:predicted O-methyltransferase YrrM